LFPILFRNKYLLLISANPRSSRVRRHSRNLRVTDIEDGFPHSEIRGSKFVRNSPRLIAAYHVLHRLSAPRHSPNTLKTLDRSHYRYPLLGSSVTILWQGLLGLDTFLRPACFKHTRGRCGLLRPLTEALVFRRHKISKLIKAPTERRSDVFPLHDVR
jgi:hypothetical protein